MRSSIATEWSGAAAGRAIVRCAEYERQLGGGSPLSSLMAAKRTFTTEENRDASFKNLCTHNHNVRCGIGGHLIFPCRLFASAKTEHGASSEWTSSVNPIRW